uniref:Multidrug resistance-associated protein 4-like n=1 Tax=Cynoglossus semilaevis TaxID=244447 RepID=A0A3P8VQU0_CYNSE
MTDRTETDGKLNPLQSAGWLSQLFLCWLSPLLRLGYKQKLEESDMYSLLSEFRCDVLGEELQRFWGHEVRRVKELWKPQLSRVLLRCYGKSYAVAGVFAFSLALRLSSYSMGQTDTGQIVNLLANDVNRFDEITINLHYLWLAPLQAVVIIVFLWHEIGLSCLAGVAVVALMLPVQTWFGKLFGIFRSKTAHLTDHRIRVINEVVSGIRIIKMYAWEKPFFALVTEVRRKEIHQILKSSYLRGLNLASFFASSKIIVFFTFALYSLLGNTITASTVFVTVSLYGTIKITVTLFFPLAVEKISETIVSIQRIEVMKVTLDAYSLCDVSFSVRSNQLLTVIGSVGSGKSSLLSAILGELPHDTGTLQVRGQLAYASQQPWVFPGTIRSNILFGRDLNPRKYEAVIRACALKSDLELLPDGDMTLIGDRGATLSGGQKARVNLARAVYQDADVYLLDDPLSSVDPEVGKHIFEQCICGLLKNKSCILVTHQLQHLRANDQTLVLKEVCASNIQYCCKTNVKFSFLHLRHDVVTSLQVDFVCAAGEETRVDGDVSSRIYLKYFTADTNILFLMFIVLLSIIAEVNSQTFLCACSCMMWPRLGACLSGLGLYCICLTAAAVVLGYARSLLICHGLVRSSQKLHNSMFKAILHTPVSFFDANPIGRILNRFTKDIGQMDSMLPMTFVDFYQLFLQNIGVVAVAAYIIPLILIPIIPLMFVFVYLRRFYLRTSRAVKRLESTARSPIFSHLSSSLHGLWTIRVFKAEDRLQRVFDNHQDLHSEVWFLFLMTSRWFALYLDTICSIFVTFTSFGCIFLRNGLGAGEVGLVLTYAVTLVGNFQWTVRQSAEVENMMTSVERVVEYTQLKSEASWETEKCPPSNWPSQGKITFNRVNLSYNCDSPRVLKDINVTFKPQEKVGIVGRTGAGKSSLISALFRLSEPEGNIYIDEVLISEIGLHDLRQRMSIIPQDPLLFTDTVRQNLDPLNQHSDEVLWRTLEEVQLKSVVEELPAKMDTVLSESGSNFSVGQRQLVCLARALLRKNRILIIDEATANVDLRTDELIQRTIRDKFRECTVLTIAHRLNTIIDSDRILVLDNGVIQEYDLPFTLLQNKEGALYKLVQQMGPTEAAALLESARQVRSNVTCLNFSLT